MNNLSRREYQMAELIAAGLTNKQIAEKLIISIRTVETHIYNARIRLDAANRYELAKAVFGEVIPPPCHRCPQLLAAVQNSAPEKTND